MLSNKSFSVCRNFMFVHYRAFHMNVVLTKAKRDVKTFVKKDKFMDAEKDPEKLCNYVCGLNIMKNGQDPKIGPDSEYPDWLWELKLTKGPYKHEPDSYKYWRQIRRRTHRLMNKERKKVY